MLTVAKKKKRTWSGKKLKELREAAKMSQAELAEKADIRPAAVSDYERDEAEPTFSTLLKLAAALGVGLDAFDPRTSG
jgi:transcriptional regulator with XRE-family HTH domain